MIKPYIVCHMMTSVDGRIDCAMTEHLPGVQEYYDTLNALDAPTRISGRVTAELKTYDEAKKSIDETLEKMGLDYLDQMIIHSPQPWNQFRVEKRYSEENKAVWRALEDAQSEGKVRVIGGRTFCATTLKICSPTAA